MNIINDKNYIFLDDIHKLDEKEFKEIMNAMENNIITYRKISQLGIDDI